MRSGPARISRPCSLERDIELIRYADELGFDEFFIGELWVEDRVAAGDDIGQGFGPETRIPGKRDELSLMRAQVNFSLTLPSHGPLVSCPGSSFIRSTAIRRPDA